MPIINQKESKLHMITPQYMKEITYDSIDEMDLSANEINLRTITTDIR